ncbi:hypothetical protein [Streptomyces sp. NPDC051921]|uniref:hypothetical protein n=1 Tax=Streptomyces sp. NPDC051921 TaxID=3155806 RepID=UPI0034268552
MSSASSADMSKTERTERAPRPGRLTAAAVVAGVEGLALAVGGLYLLVSTLTDRPDDLTSALMGGATLVALGLIPLVAARGLWLRRSWSRGPAVIMQILALPVAWQLLHDEVLIPAGIALAVLAVTGLVMLVSPATTEALGIKRPGQDSP